MDLPSASIKGSVRHELDVRNGFEYDVKFAGSRGDFELGAVTYNPSHGFSTDSIGNLSTSDFEKDLGVVKYDQQIGRFVVGGSYNILEAELALRLGLGSKDTNIYLELGIDFFAGFDAIFAALSSDTYENNFLPGVRQGATVVIATDTDGNRTAYYTDDDSGLRVKTPVVECH